MKPQSMRALGILHVLLMMSSVGYAQLTPIPDPNFWVTDGPVHVVHRNGQDVYIGGNFNFVGPNAPFGVVLDSATGRPDLSYFKPNDSVFAVVADGNGGWYIGGAFTELNGYTRSHLAHMLADGSLDPIWKPVVDGIVRALALNEGILYFGGDFSNVNGHAAGRIAAVNASTGIRVDWNPDANGAVLSIAVSGGKVFVGGKFTQIGGQLRNYVAALQKTDGSANALWNPNPDGFVYALSLAGDRLFLGGDFLTVGNLPRNHVAALDTSGAGSLPGFTNPNTNGPVRSLAFAGGTLYIGGFYTFINGQFRSNIAAVSLSNGNLTDWNPGAGGVVRSLAVSGDVIYVGGDFMAISSKERYRIAALDRITGFEIPWVSDASAAVYALAVQSGKVYAGGGFTIIGGKPRRNIAAFDAVTGTATPWNPNANGDVRAIAVRGDTVFVGGDFTAIGREARNRIAALDAITESALGWDPNFGRSVYAIALKGDRVYVGGDFIYAGEATHRYLTSVSILTGKIMYLPYLDGAVYSLSVSGDKLYVGGAFISNGEPRNRLAALDLSTMVFTPFNPNANDTVHAVAASGCKVYAGGKFTKVRADERYRVASLDDCSSGGSIPDETGAATAWNPYINERVRSLALKGDTVFIGGDFTAVNGQDINRLAGLNATTGSLLYWTPNANGTVRTLAANDNALYAGGDFTEIGDKPQRYFVAFTGVTDVHPSNTFGGTIAADQSGVGPYISTPFTEVSPPSGYTGEVEYRWQSSFISATEGFTDIPSANQESYWAGVVDRTTWFKRIVKPGGNAIPPNPPGGEPTQESNVLRILIVTKWIGGNGNWNIDSNWSTGAVPTSINVILIQDGNPKLDVDFTLLGSLTIKDSGSLTVNPGKTLTIAGSADFGNRPVIFRSDATGTAQLGRVTGSLVNICNVTVERYIPPTGRRWRLLTAPLDSVTINGGWQNGKTWNGTSVLSNDTTGTLITGLQQGSAATANSRGFDFWSAISNSSSTILSYLQRSGQGAWTTLSNTKSPKAFNGNKAYLLFVRGPRQSQYSSGTANAATTLRPTGCIRVGEVLNTIDGTKGYTLLGNPYPSQIDFDSVYWNAGNSAVIKRQFWMWDATNGTSGNFQAVVYSGGRYVEVPMKFHTAGQSSPLTAIQSGHGFFVLPFTTTGGTMRIRESNKIATPSASPNILLSDDKTPRVFVNLMKRDGDGIDVIADGVMVAYGEGYGMHTTDADDAPKLENLGENLAVVNGDDLLIADARPMSDIQRPVELRLWNAKPGRYRFEAKVEGMGELGLKAFLEDRLTGRRTPLEMNGDVSSIEMIISEDNASKAEDRFRIVFEKASVNASLTPEEEKGGRKMTVYPNPLTEGRSLNVRLQGLPAGSYTLQLISSDGRVVATRRVEHGEGTGTYRIEWDATLPKGTYRLRCMGTGGSVDVETLFVQ